MPEALDLLAVPGTMLLAGGTGVNAGRGVAASLVDLQALGLDVARFKSFGPLPRNASLNWFMPAPVNNSDASPSGTSESDA